MYKMFIEKIISVKKLVLLLWCPCVKTPSDILCLHMKDSESMQKVYNQTKQIRNKFRKIKAFNHTDNKNSVRLFSYTNVIF